MCTLINYPFIKCNSKYDTKCNSKLIQNALMIENTTQNVTKLKMVLALCSMPYQLVL